MSLPQVFFIYFALAMTVLSVLVVTRRNPIHSVLWMLILFVHIAGLYLFLNAEFLAAVQIIVYAGAIMVLFIFVIMLLNLKIEESEKKFQTQWPIGAGISVILAVFFFLVLRETSVFPTPGAYTVDAVRSEGSIMVIGKVLYTEFLMPFEIASIILLVAIIGAVVLSKKRLE